MKIALLSGASSIHTVRWANGLNAVGHNVYVISKHPLDEPFHPAVKVHILTFSGAIGYFRMVPEVRKLLDKIKPDIVNAHYASGYGTTARLVGYHPWVLSVWGSDVYDFPYKSFIHKWLVKKNLRAADRIASTSLCMAEQTRTLTPELSNIAITPFGVDLISYEGLKPELGRIPNKIVIGTVKTMKPNYGIDILIEAYALLIKSLHEKLGNFNLELELKLVGGGEQTEELKNLATKLGVADSVKFIGQVQHSLIPQELASLDIYVALSRMESFGVAVIEASAAGLPVVVSDTGGLREVTVAGKTGFIVPREDPIAAAAALEKLVFDPELRHKLGCAGKVHVAENYSWMVCIKTMLNVYADVISKSVK